MKKKYFKKKEVFEVEDMKSILMYIKMENRFQNPQQFYHQK
jgi:hypothetical protein